jgi:hypothetical protein
MPCPVSEACALVPSRVRITRVCPTSRILFQFSGTSRACDWKISREYAIIEVWQAVKQSSTAPPPLRLGRAWSQPDWT